MHLAILRLWPRLVIRKMQQIPHNFHHLSVTSSHIFPIQSIPFPFIFTAIGPIESGDESKKKETRTKNLRIEPFYCSVVLECRECYIFLCRMVLDHIHFSLYINILINFLFDTFGYWTIFLLVIVVIVFPHNRIRFVVKHI